jgi:hypothetical protein
VQRCFASEQRYLEALVSVAERCAISRTKFLAEVRSRSGEK